MEVIFGIFGNIVLIFVLSNIRVNYFWVGYRVEGGFRVWFVGKF